MLKINYFIFLIILHIFIILGKVQNVSQLIIDAGKKK